MCFFFCLNLLGEIFLDNQNNYFKDIKTLERGNQTYREQDGVLKLNVDQKQTMLFG